MKHCNFEYSNAVYFNDIFYGAVSFNASGATIQNCNFQICFAGIVSAYNSSPTLVNNNFTFNFEGGTLCWKSPGTKIINNEYFGNLGYGIRCYQSSPAITNSTITFDGTQPDKILHSRNFVDTSVMLFKPENKNFLYGMYLENNSDPNIQNTIIYANGIYEEGENIHLEGGSTPTISYSLLSDSLLPAGAIDGGNNILGHDPVFNDPSKLDFSLNAASPCINTGNPDTTGLNLPGLDLAGNSRLYEDGPIDMGAYEFQAMVQKVILAQGWSGISAFINPGDDDVVQMFDPIINDLIILQNASGMFWPEQNINTIGSWNTHQGYQVKVADSVELFIAGTRENNKTLQLTGGWNLIPVLSECEVDMAGLFNGTDLIIIKEVAGWGIYWPEFGINTLGALSPGKAYFVLMGSEGDVTFPGCER